MANPMVVVSTPNSEVENRILAIGAPLTGGTSQNTTFVDQGSKLDLTMITLINSLEILTASRATQKLSFHASKVLITQRILILRSVNAYGFKVGKKVRESRLTQISVTLH